MQHNNNNNNEDWFLKQSHTTKSVEQKQKKHINEPLNTLLVF